MLFPSFFLSVLSVLLLMHTLTHTQKHTLTQSARRKRRKPLWESKTHTKTHYISNTVLCYSDKTVSVNTIKPHTHTLRCNKMVLSYKSISSMYILYFLLLCVRCCGGLLVKSSDVIFIVCVAGLLAFIIHAFFLVKTWCLHYPQCNSTTDRSVQGSDVLC